MDEERFDQLYNRILEDDNWDYSTLDELICLAESGAREKAMEEMREKALEAFCSFVEDYCSESGRKDISSESEHYIEVFKSKLED